MIIAVDFDGTVVKHEYPNVGETLDGAVETLKEIVGNGHQLILWTMRSGKELKDAIDWYDKNKIPLYGINGNPQQRSWTESPKAYAQIYIDDAALGCPCLIDVKKVGDESLENVGRPYVDWEKVRDMLETKGVINDD